MNHNQVLSCESFHCNAFISIRLLFSAFPTLSSASDYNILCYHPQIHCQPIIIKSMSLGKSTESAYKPFKYPPDYQLARKHQNATMPGKPKEGGESCPCCHQKLKTPFKSWWDRSIQKDFKSFGGAVVGYFWLIKLYSFTIVAIITLYAAYLQYLANYYCENQLNEGLKKEACSRLFGVWIVTNSDLKTLIQDQNDEPTLSRFFTLRGVLFLLLLVVNALSLYVIKWFKIRHPDKLNVTNFSLLFKNLKNDKLDELIRHLTQQFGVFDIKQAFIIKKIQPFYSAYQTKLQAYYGCKIEQNPKKLAKLKQKLFQMDRFCSDHQESFYNEGNRAVIVFKDLQMKERVLARYQISRLKVIQMFFNNNYEEEYRMYCQLAPRPEEILWKNIGIIEKQGFKVKVLSIIYFILILGFFVAFLYFFMEVVYVEPIIEPFKSILTNFILIFIVFVGLTFRALMNRLSQMRYPNTYTNRTMFIVITTVLFHFIFYLFIPSLFLKLHNDLRGAILSLISNQAINFIIVQITLAGFDLMFCCWNRSRKQIENQDKPIGCQKILHERMQYPRFPIEFKLIILFKFWSLITFFAFQVPLVLFLIFVVLIYLYIKDKMNIYYHYRMETIDNEVEFNFLKIYSNVFSIYLFITFIVTQYNEYEMIIGGAATVIAILVQTFYFRKLRDNEPSSRDSFITLKLDDLEEVDSYQARYEKFLHEARNDLTDVQIKQYLSRNGFGTMKTEQSISSKLLSP